MNLSRGVLVDSSMPVIQPIPMTSMRRALASALLLVAIALVAGCASRTRAPVEDRTAQPGRPPQPPVVSPSAPTAPSATPGTEASGATYVVKRGDTLARIAAAHGVSWRTLWAQNRSVCQNPNLIYPGQRLSV